MLVKNLSMNLVNTSDTFRTDHRQFKIADRLLRAIAQHELELAYQPEMDLLSRKVISLEALCRWQDAELGQVAPDEFIGVAEAKGLIVQIGEYLLQKVLEDLPTLLQRWPEVRVAINVSGIELGLPDFAHRVISHIKTVDTGLARHLEFEVTESVFHYNLPQVRDNLLNLQTLGIAVAIDDFGTGQSSLSRLHTLPFDKIKLDRSFVQALDDPMVQAIVQAMAQLADSFSRTLVAEGIETQKQLEQLSALGCQLGQGYLLCRPCNLKELPIELL
jgi:diguanylate cyclase